MAQLVEQRIRNAWVAGSSPASGSLSWYPLGTSFFCVTESHPQGSCGPCIVCWQEILSPSYIRPWNGLWPMDRPKGLGPREAHLERPLALDRPQGS